MRIDYKYKKTAKNSISNLSNLLNALDISEQEYENFLMLEEKYTSPKIKKDVYKGDGTHRKVLNPNPLIRKIQHRMLKRIFNPGKNSYGLIKWPFYLYGSIPNNINSADHTQSRDYIACAGNHCLANSVLKIDITNFFDNIHCEHVKRIFTSLLKYPDDVADALTDFCCFNGKVVQGGITSSYIASAVLFDIEPQIVKRLSQKGLVYTRLVDDITVSSKMKNYDFSFAKSIIIQALTEKDLPINNDKTQTLYSNTEDILVHGLRINYKQPRLPSDEISRIRASVKNLEILAQDHRYRVSRDYRRSYNRCLGRINKLKRLGHSQHKALLDRVWKIKPLPSRLDIYRAINDIKYLEKNHQEKKQTYWYEKKYNQLRLDLTILKRSFSRTADIIKRRMKNIKPAAET